MRKTLLMLTTAGLLHLPAFAWNGPVDEAAWQGLVQEVAAARTQLDETVAQANAAGLNTDYAFVSQTVLDLFQTYTAWDRAHPEKLETAYKKRFWWEVKKDPTAYQKLPFDELKACLEVAENAIVELRQQLTQQIQLQTPPDFSKGFMKQEDGIYRLDGVAVFPSKFTWMPTDEKLMKVFGTLGGTSYSLGQMGSDEKINAHYLARRSEELCSDMKINRVPQQFLVSHVPAQWMKQQHPEIIAGDRWFMQYDIDHPLIEGWIQKMFQDALPPLCEAMGDQPAIHIIANEPHWAFREGGIMKRPGMENIDFSEHSRNKYAEWLQNKYSTITNLNKVYGTNYTSFNEAKAAFKAPVNAEPLLGTAVWYDLCRFNMDRVNAWFTFLKEQVRLYGPKDAPVSIKLLGEHLEASYRDSGIDLETLTKLQDVLGADNQVVPLNINRNRREYSDWMNRYMLDWREQSITLDFAKSLCPEKPFQDSEWHGLSGGAWACHSLDRGYVRTALWMAFSHGLTGMNVWVWGRDEDGKLSTRSNPISEILSMPTALDSFGRTMKELNAHAEILHALATRERAYFVYYCEEAAIQDHTYPGQMADVYESLKLLNVPVGFTTPTELATRSIATQTLIVPPTKFISDASLAALKTFEQRGGKIVFVSGNTENFAKNELGHPRTGLPELKNLAAVEFEAVLRMADALETALASVKPPHPVPVSITDEGGAKAYGVLASQAADPETGAPVVLLINLSQDVRCVTLAKSPMLNLLTGETMPNKLTMDRYDILLLRQEP
jgi:hypothetical protein